MVNFALDDLCRPAGEGLDPGLELFVLPPDFDGLVALALSWAARQGKAAFLRVIQAAFLQ